MCFFYNGKLPAKAKVAAEDIECYKFLQKGESKEELYSPLFDTGWTANVHATTFMLPEIESDDINQGFHSLKTVKQCVEYRESECEYGQVYKFIIPAGSLYYENETRYVSNQIYLTSYEPEEE